MFTKKQEKVYLESGGTKCPKCGSENIEEAELNADGTGVVSQEIYCLDCYAKWYEYRKNAGKRSDSSSFSDRLLIHMTPIKVN